MIEYEFYRSNPVTKREELLGVLEEEEKILPELLGNQSWVGQKKFLVMM